ncbi:MAG: acyltransferase [Hyphomicrobiaceae bacterium]|nr:acyltransferase [Hyphomicrobiaceae bacterium]
MSAATQAGAAASAGQGYFDTTSAAASAVSSVPKSATEARLLALDGARGAMTLMVVISHFFAEVSHGWSAVSFGWIGVIAFFALSGFLVGDIILEKGSRANFYAVFYMRRVCRLLPVYFVSLTLIWLALAALGNGPLADIHGDIPMWSYATFTQNFFIASSGEIGAYWLLPTWTLTVEWHFYLLSPVFLILMPRRHLLKVLLLLAFVPMLVRAWILWGTDLDPHYALTLLPARADALLLGVAAAVAYRENRLSLARYELALRAAPVLLLGLAFVVRLQDEAGSQLNQVFGFFLVALAAALYILSIARGSPEAESMKSKVLTFYARNSYAIYLTHLTVLGLMHALLLGAKPDVATPVQIAVTIAAFPVATALGWLLTRYVEDPVRAYGRTWKWAKAEPEKIPA